MAGRALPLRRSETFAKDSSMINPKQWQDDIGLASTCACARAC
jgi:hypothetical protein